MRPIAPLALALLTGCGWWGASPVDPTVQRRALASTAERPAQGSPTERTFRGPWPGGKRLPSVTVLTPEVRGLAPGDPEVEAFRQRLVDALGEGARQALLGSGRVAAASAGAGAAACRVEALAHVGTAGGTVTRDAAFGDPRSKLVVVYSLEDPATGQPFFRYTTWAVAHWEYGPWAMDELVSLALATAGEFAEALKE